MSFLFTIAYYLLIIKLVLGAAYYLAHKWFVSCVNTKSKRTFDKTPSVKKLMENPSVTTIHIGTFPFWSPKAFAFSVIDAIFFKRWLMGRITLSKSTDDGAGIMDAPVLINTNYRGFRHTFLSTFTLTNLPDITTYFKGLLKVLYMHVPVFINDYEYVGTLFDVNKATMEESVSNSTETPAERLKRLRAQRSQPPVQIVIEQN
uniref:Uncharacterized protein n=1 Tax=Clandestinovirus TaxID=2831644 RepID=A0A8F8PNE2_9VIRU|nr:hypothetical protein KOM_12_474 [Clandestinovirus]